MAKSKVIYFCNECGYESPNWRGQCPACKGWNCFVESTKVTGAAKNSQAAGAWLEELFPNVQPCDLQSTLSDQQSRMLGTGDSAEFARILGGGLVKGSLLLIGGEPGIGKSTLLLKLCEDLEAAKQILYVCGEESPQQIKLRAERLNIKRKGILLFPEVNFDKIAQAIIKIKPELVIVDSIQTIYSNDNAGNIGAVSQIKQVTAGFLRLAKSYNTTIVLVGHITKDGQIAGPLVLEHMVDTVLLFEGDREHDLRILRTLKNRFGAANEIAIYTMESDGLKAVSNPSELLLTGRPQAVSGSAITAQLEGARSLLLETQALLTPANVGQALRMTQGFDRNRLNLLLALLSKQFGLNLLAYDVFINVVAGLRITEPACDLAIAAAILSSYYDLALSENALFLGELGLTGEIRQVSKLEKRLQEAIRLGFTAIYLPSSNKSALKSLTLPEPVNIYLLDHLKDLPDLCFSNATKAKLPLKQETKQAKATDLSS